MLRRIMLRRSSWILAICVGCALSVVELAVFKRIDLLSYDFMEPVFRPSSGQSEAIIVAVDERSLSALGQWPWDRSVHASLVDIVTRAGASVVVIPIIFSEPGWGDQALATAIERARKVVLPVVPIKPEFGFAGVQELLPTPLLSGAAAALGHVDVELDADALARRIYLRAGSGEPRWDAMALAALKISRSTVSLDQGADASSRWVRPVSTAWHRSGELLLPFPDASLAPSTLSYFDVLGHSFPAHMLAGKAVFIGTTAGGLDAGLATPASPEGMPMAAVEFHARIFNALQTNGGYQPATSGLTLMVSTGFLFLVAVIYPFLGIRTAGWAGLLVVFPFLISGAGLYVWQLWIPAVPAAVGFACGYLGWFASSLRYSRASLRQARRDADATLRSIADGVITVDDSGAVVLANPVVSKLTGWSLERIQGLDVRGLLADFCEDLNDVLRSLDDCLHSQQTLRMQTAVRWRTPHGPVRSLQITLTPVGEQGAGMVLVLTDISEMLAAHEQLRHEATHDAMTGLPNRVLLLDRLQRAIPQAARQEEMCALLFVDLDRFKRINDSLGHSAGDEVLRVVAKRLSAAVREDDTVSRWGGDEFIILMESLKERNAVVTVAEKILRTLEGEVSLEDGANLVLSCSIGIALAPNDSNDPQQLLSMADKAMYQGKSEGGSGYSFYSPEMNTWTRDRLGLESALRAALGRREFELFYQPQVDIVNGRLVGFESLIRWRRPKEELIRPDVFIPVAEESGLICSIGEWVIHEAVAQVARWRADGLLQVRVAINVSARQCNGEALVETMSHAIMQNDVDTAAIQVEITESTAMKDSQHAALLLNNIHNLGVKIALDDFGTGYSSLGLLRSFPISELKIDRSFVSDVGRENDDGTVARGMIALAHGMGMKVVAEGVETSAQMTFLAKHGCDIVQGYLIAPPLPEDQARQWLKALPEHVEQELARLRRLKNESALES